MDKSELLLDVIDAKLLHPFRDIGYYFGKIDNYLMFVESPISLNCHIICPNAKNYLFTKNEIYKTHQLKYLNSVIFDTVKNNKYNWQIPSTTDINHMVCKMYDYKSTYRTEITTENYMDFNICEIKHCQLSPILKIYV
jgi:hypothetical protein